MLQTTFIDDLPGKPALIIQEGLFCPESLKVFQALVWTHHASHRRSFVWREQCSPYNVFVSEVMLQQTQTERVAKKFPEFIATFPDFNALASAPIGLLLSTWQGMGYNRRALWLQKSALIIQETYNGILPQEPEHLRALPGIGPNTAGSVAAFAHDLPTVFIETNIRTVFLHYAFPGQRGITDKQLLPLITQTVDHSHPREWYYALMDLGVALKKQYKNPSRRSAHHTIQSKFEGSDRQIRGALLRLFGEYHRLTYEQIYTLLPFDRTRTERLLNDLIAEGFLKNESSYITFS